LVEHLSIVSLFALYGGGGGVDELLWHTSDLGRLFGIVETVVFIDDRSRSGRWIVGSVRWMPFAVTNRRSGRVTRRRSAIRPGGRRPLGP
jgi:hypothetical protein